MKWSGNRPAEIVSDGNPIHNTGTEQQQQARVPSNSFPSPSFQDSSRERPLLPAFNRSCPVQRLELTPLPLGLIEEETEEDPDDDTITAEPVRHQPCAPKISRIDQDELTPVVSRDADVHHRGGVAVLRLTDYQPPPELTPSVASTTELIPTSCSLSSFAATAESSGHLPAWLDNASLMAMSLNLSNIYRLPTFLYFSYPGESFIAYLILMTAVGLPLYVMELALGQFGRTGIFKLWRAVPLLKGLGVAQIIIGMYQTFYFPTLMTWSFQFGVIDSNNGCQSTLTQNVTCLCPSSDSNCSRFGIISMEETCFQNEVLNVGKYHMNYKMLLMLTFSVAIVTLGASFGIKLMKIFLILIGATCATLLCFLLVLALIHPSNKAALNGLKLLIPSMPLWSFVRAEVWVSAMVQVLFSLSVGFGTLPSMTSSSSFSRDIIRQGVLLWFVNVFWAVISVMTMFSWIGLSGLHDAAKQYTFLYSVFYNNSSSLANGSAFALFFLAGMNSMLPVICAILHNLEENLGVLKERWILVCSSFGLFIFVINIPGVTQVGNEVIIIWDKYGTAVVLTLLVYHLIGWMSIYQGKRLKWDFEFMFRRPISYLWNFQWGLISIALLTASQLWMFFGMPLDGDEAGCRFPLWVIGAGWAAFIFPLPVAMIILLRVLVHQTEYGLIPRFATAIKPDRSWGPANPFLLDHYKRTVDRDLPLMNILSDGGRNSPDSFKSGRAEHEMRESQAERASISLVELPDMKRQYGPSGIVYF